jgi:hypothetical protein
MAITDTTMQRYTPAQIARWGVAKKEPEWRHENPDAVTGVIVNRRHPHQKLRRRMGKWEGVR